MFNGTLKLYNIMAMGGLMIALLVFAAILVIELPDGRGATYIASTWGAKSDSIWL